jgi:predicted membrane protein
MPLLLLIIGAMLASSAYNGTTGELQKAVVKDFTGNGNFIYWLVSIGIVGGIGYIPRMEHVSKAFLVLILLVIVLANSGTSGTGGFFAQFADAIKNFTPSGASAVGGPVGAVNPAAAVNTAGANAIGAALGGTAAANAIAGAGARPDVGSIIPGVPGISGWGF